MLTGSEGEEGEEGEDVLLSLDSDRAALSGLGARAGFGASVGLGLAEMVASVEAMVASGGGGLEGMLLLLRLS